MLIATAENTSVSFNINIDTRGASTVTAEFSPAPDFRTITLTKILTPADPVVINLSSTEVNQIKDCHFRVTETKNAKSKKIADGKIDFVAKTASSLTAADVGADPAGAAAAAQAAAIAAIPSMSKIASDPALRAAYAPISAPIVAALIFGGR